MINRVQEVLKSFIRTFSTFKAILKFNFYVRTFLIGLIGCLLFSCSTEDFNIGSNFVESKSSISIVDTFKVELSTYLLDSIETSADTTILIGNYSDTLFGKVTCNSVFEITIPAEKDFEIDDVFDSLCLVLLPNDYYYGDTIQNHGFSVHRLLSNLETYSDGYLYNTTPVSFQAEALGFYNWHPQPLYTDSIFVLLDDSFGQELFEMYMNDEEYTTASEFLEYFKGLYIQSDTLNTNSVIAFNATTVVMRMYYHRYGEHKQDLFVDFPLINTDEQFNQIITDYSSSSYLSGITLESNELKANQTGNLVFMQEGTGLYQKILFPSLSEILLFNPGALLKAELVLYPEKTSYQSFSLPYELALYKTNKYNNFIEAITDSEGNTVFSSLTQDLVFHEDTYYTFDITQYINDQMDKKYFDPTSGLFIVPGSGTISSSLERLVLTSESFSPILNLYYVNFTD
jgi:hypothetical protein